MEASLLIEYLICIYTYLRYKFTIRDIIETQYRQIIDL